ncbi:hypothetical protein [Pseudomonas paraeruginosa]|uniref:hypothetical protein n=1 Tax=Pseudomonas paraeruginosa TaxID=2994495 RepID=UPI0039FDB0DF
MTVAEHMGHVADPQFQPALDDDGAGFVHMPVAGDHRALFQVPESYGAVRGVDEAGTGAAVGIDRMLLQVFDDDLFHGNHWLHESGIVRLPASRFSGGY